MLTDNQLCQLATGSQMLIERGKLVIQSQVNDRRLFNIIQLSADYVGDCSCYGRVICTTHESVIQYINQGAMEWDVTKFFEITEL